jgi:hypothetical protein
MVPPVGWSAAKGKTLICGFKEKALGLSLHSGIDDDLAFKFPSREAQGRPTVRGGTVTASETQPGRSGSSHRYDEGDEGWWPEQELEAEFSA